MSQAIEWKRVRNFYGMLVHYGNGDEGFLVLKDGSKWVAYLPVTYLPMDEYCRMLGSFKTLKAAKAACQAWIDRGVACRVAHAEIRATAEDSTRGAVIMYDDSVRGSTYDIGRVILQLMIQGADTVYVKIGRGPTRTFRRPAGMHRVLTKR